ncbi:hypothetical protein BDY17DRAFT_324611 [Neohortaea acidophila]|uniref:Acetyl-CoA synthetase-like protein n=1 Tax=Neohortaea acidophila TaxID=245834 RepID=A0A6A6PRM2_9PEZI|nr:uncharacterized protein BDY17DRAFT_324611 [Neohortaea acidophila]KAF2482321.1 hypothetical protein BDY17DRAFT_324611 [Neohortaea acidophila]
MLALAFAGLVAQTTAHLNQVTVYSGGGCTGNSVFASTDVSANYCFEGLGGASFGGFGSTCGQGGGFVTTWSGGNCEGSSQTFSFPEGCQTIPFVPTNLTIWEWAFESPEYSPVIRYPKEKLGSYINAITKERLDFADVKLKATLLSAALVNEYGLQPGDTVSLFSTNTIWYPVVMWATLRAGACVNGASPAYNVEEMTHALQTAGTKFVLTLPNAIEAARAACAAVGIPERNIFLLEGEHAGFTSIQDLIELGKYCTEPAVHPLPAGKTNRDVCAFLNFSSGTTGLPKAVILSHHNIIAQCHQLRQLQVVPPGERYKILAVMPLFHITGLVRFCNYPVFMNGDSIMLPSFTMDSMLKAIVEFNVPELILVPPILIRMVRDPIVDKYLPDLQRIVKRWSSGSAPIAPEIIQLLRKRFPDTGFRQGYGGTGKSLSLSVEEDEANNCAESTACISCHPPTHYDYKYASTTGLLVANTVAKVLDLNDPTKELGPNETGEILAKGPQIALGYLNNPKASAETFDKDGFFHTGDVGHFDDEGLIHIEDRIKEMIKVKGQQVAPAELEDLLLGHDLVEDCAVLGLQDMYAGERPKAYVVLKQGVKPSEEVGRKLLAFVKERKVRYKWIQEIEFAEVVPKTPTGKTLRRVLKAKDREEGRKRGVVVVDEREKAKL